MNALKLKFTSGNDIPVERAVVTRTEFEAIVEEFERMAKERDEWKAKKISVFAELERSAKRIMNRMYSPLKIGKRGEDFLRQEYNEICIALRAYRGDEDES